MSTLHLSADHESARAIGPWLQERLDALGSSQRERIGELELAIHEVAINIIDHALGGSTGSSADAADAAQFTITLDTINGGRGTSSEELRVQLQDPGTAFVSAAAPDLDQPQVRGYGLFIAEQLTSELSYERIGEVNVWTLIFTPSSPPDQQTQETTP